MPENENIQQENPQEVNDISQEQTIEQFQTSDITHTCLSFT